MRLFIFTHLFCFIACSPVFSQTKTTYEIPIGDGKNIDLSAIEVESSADFKKIVASDFQFPLMLLPSRPMNVIFNVLNEQNSLITNLENENKLLSEKSQIDSLSIYRLQNIISIQNRVIDLNESSNNTLNRSFATLSNELDSSKQYNHDLQKQIYGRRTLHFIFGGTAGLTLGIVLGLLINK